MARLAAWLAAWLAAICLVSMTATSATARDIRSGSVLLADPASVAATPNPAHWVVARISFSDYEDLNRLAARLDVWDVDHEGRVLVAPISLAEMETMREAGRTVTVDEALTRLAQEPIGEEAAVPGTIPGFPCYRTVEELYRDMAALAAEHPGLAEWIQIGESWDKTKPGGPEGHDLHALILTNKATGGAKFRFFLMAAIHARELATTEVAARFAEHLVARYGSDPEVTWLLDYGEIHIVVVVNPDGRLQAEQRVLWRKNTNRDVACSDNNPYFSYYGVDLNRNSSFKWNQCQGSQCSSGFACDDTYRGTAPASEPETRAVEEYVRSIFADRRGPADGDAAATETSGLFVSLHSFGNEVLFPWGWTDQAPPNLAALATLARKFGYYMDYVACQAGAPGCIYQTDGTTDDWAYGELGVAAYTFEIGTWFFEACDYFESQIQGRVFDALTYGFKAARLPYLVPSGPESLSVVASPAVVDLGQPFTVTATADDSRYNSNGFGVEPVQTIAGGRISVDAPSWITASEEISATIPMSFADGSGDAAVEGLIGVVDTTGWTPGRHILFVEAMDSAGNWGVPSAVFVDVYAEGVAFAVSPRRMTGEAFRLQPASYAITITNTGVLTDTYVLSFVGTQWPVAYSQNPVGPLAPGETSVVTVTVTPAGSARSGAVGRTNIHVTSQANPTRWARVRLDTALLEITRFLPLAGR